MRNHTGDQGDGYTKKRNQDDPDTEIIYLFPLAEKLCRYAAGLDRHFIRLGSPLVCAVKVRN